MQHLAFRIRHMPARTKILVIGVCVTMVLHAAIIHQLGGSEWAASEMNPLSWLSTATRVDIVRANPPAAPEPIQQSHAPVGPNNTGIQPVTIAASPVQSVMKQTSLQPSHPKKTRRVSTAKSDPDSDYIEKPPAMFSAPLEITGTAFAATPHAAEAPSPASRAPRVVAGWQQRQILYAIASRNRAAAKKPFPTQEVVGMSSQ